MEVNYQNSSLKSCLETRRKILTSGTVTMLSPLAENTNGIQSTTKYAKHPAKLWNNSALTYLLASSVTRQKLSSDTVSGGRYDNPILQGKDWKFSQMSHSTPQAAQECPDHFQLPEPLLPGICSYPHFLTHDPGPSLCHSKGVTADAAAMDLGQH